MNGNSDRHAIDAAKTVLPDPGSPFRRTLTRGVRSDLATWLTNSFPFSSIS